MNILAPAWLAMRCPVMGLRRCSLTAGYGFSLGSNPVTAHPSKANPVRSPVSRSK